LDILIWSWAKTGAMVSRELEVVDMVQGAGTGVHRNNGCGLDIFEAK
jgi:hypothetical protein